MAAAPKQLTTEVDGQTMKLTNLGKVLYPEVGFTKAEVIDYYLQVAPQLLPHLSDRPLTRKRWPDGTGAAYFFEKNAPRGTPDWVRTVTLPTPGSSTGRDEADFVIADDIQTIVWLANLAALELHVPQWRIGLSDTGKTPHADLVVFDLDPGPGATVVDCCDVALALRELLSHYGMEGWPKTSGNKGMHLYVPIEPAPSRDASAFAKQLAEQLAEALPESVTANMTKALRPGKVFIDWSQNASAKTTLAPYSLRGAEEPRVSTPIDWDEVAAATDPAELTFLPADVLARIEEYGDVLEGLYDDPKPLPS
ncbi:bifunctional non-homologous end joining protein LigD [Kribbella orskensis]|uniref:Bifunctional non-homologous end joining protein LigD n=1 Tax=Kribbella orskensis TaxID=2512216 RepID=A0ABY2BC53_9ACTN|nr:MULTISPECIES: non-homologous end-joining DNA ligase [Kribbella]TCN34896.1 bifunctional non-homologous end joining protein LigD [Kribbella sp. VKM Ac-2500]TCO15602.1 bifunctional non-homologous end joining protein LigD [Kribbella orskensis]